MTMTVSMILTLTVEEFTRDIGSSLFTRDIGSSLLA